MKLNDRDSLTELIHQNNEKYQELSRRIHWTVADSDCLDNLVDSKEQQKDIAGRITRATGSRLPTTYLSLLLAFKAWQRTKAVYSFDREFVEAMSYTEDTTILISLLERLPFRDMLFFFPEGTLPKIKGEETAGMYVHIESHSGFLWINFNYLDRINKDSEIYPGISFAFLITNEMKVSQVFETPEYLEWLSTYKQTVLIDRQLNEQEAEESLLAEKKVLNTAINLMYYLSSKEPDIKQIKQHKKPKKKTTGKKEDSDPAIKLHEVGTKYAEIIYKRVNLNEGPAEEDSASDENEEDETVEGDVITVKPGKKRRPHVRRAHFQQYWTGEGRTIPVLHWIPDLFVGVNQDDQAVVVYEAKQSLKGKRNPNTSKKKRKD